MIALPPLEAGAPKETVAEALPAMAVTFVGASAVVIGVTAAEAAEALTLVGAPAVVTGVTGAEGLDGALVPAAFVAVTVKV